jgi:IS1 family transposase
VDRHLSSRAPDRGLHYRCRSETTAQKRSQALPESYRTCPVYTDAYAVYSLITPSEQHRPAPKDVQQTNHPERWNNTLRQWLQRFTRNTLSFSKEDTYHSLVTHWFIIEYNLRMQAYSRRCRLWSVL